MTSPVPIFLTLAATALTAGAAPRLALVRVTEIYAALPSTISLKDRIKSEREQIMRDQRAEKLRKIVSELQTLQGQLSDKAKPLDEVTARSLARAYELKRQEALTLQQDFESYQSEQEKEINRRMVTGMRASLDQIAEVTRTVAKERGFDAVIDSSGNTNTGVPFVLYSKNAPDITADVNAAIKDLATPAPEATSADKPKSAAN
ncbi:MAG: OmpH family outer membrane protein [Verrucomicrobiota bacterium]